MNKYKIIKISRVVAGLAVLLLFFLIFLLPENSLGPAAKWQFLPSLLRTAAGAGIAAVATLAVFLVLTLLFGRVYCSFICPLGIFQDIAGRLAKLVKLPRSKKTYTPNHHRLRYSVLVLLVTAAVFGVAVPLGLFGPFAAFGRFNAAVVKPVFNWINNFMVDNAWFESLYPLKNKPFSLPLLFVGGLSALVVFVAAFFRGRIFCNTLCPAGALLGLLAKTSWFKVKLDEIRCVSCGKCAKVCKAGCIDIKNRIVDNERCVACFNCATVCNFGAISYTHNKNQKNEVGSEPEKNKQGLSRRDFLAIGGSALVGAAVVPKLLRSISPAKHAVMPPGALNLDHFTSKCTACQLCVSNCPGKVLKPAALEYGIGGFMQPRLDFDSGMCEFECNTCSNICPNEALVPLKLEDKKLVQIGLAEYFSKRCVVVTDRTYCGACAEHCPTGAVHMVDWEEGLTIPKVEQELCIGCGACEFICPVKPSKAIIVSGKTVHGKARKGKSKQVTNHLKGQDFPF
jgi:polyferredoxin